MTRKKKGFVWVLHPNDNVGSLVGDDAKVDSQWCLRGSTSGELLICCSVPHGHKVALKNIRRGQPVIKYGAPIGRTTRAVRVGEHVHVHNMESLRGRGDLQRAVDPGSSRSKSSLVGS